MHPEDREKNALICPLGFYEFDRMPQGLSGTSANFQHLMKHTVGDMNLTEVLVYLNDIIVFSSILEEYEEWHEKVLQRLHDEGLKLSLKKYQFYQPSVTYLGHVVSAEVVATDPKKLETVTSWPRSSNETELRSILGFRSYNQRFVEGFAKIAQSPTKLLKIEARKMTDQQTKGPSKP